MILGTLSDAARYSAIQAGLEAGFQFLQRPDLADLPDGRQEIDGERLFAIVAREQGRGTAESPLEFHRRYLDIQYVVQGFDLIGWLPTSECRHVRDEYDENRDLGFYLDRPATWCRLAAGNFAIFFPEDAHAPLAGTGPIHKVVVKLEL